MYNLSNKQIKIFGLIVILLAYCFPLANAQSTKDKTMNNRLNIAEYNQHKDLDGIWYFTLTDNSKGRVLQIENEYLEHIELFNSPYIRVSLYNKDGILVETAKNFYDIKLDMENYDLQGNMIKRTTYDAPYKLTIEALRKIIQDKFNIDIMNTRQVFAVNRFEDKKVTNLPYYLVRYVDQQNDQRYHQVLLNGNTGEILHTVDGYFVREGNPDIWQEYLKSLKTK